MSQLASQPAVIQSIYSWFREDKLLVNRRYQRKLVWTLDEKQRLIESILKGYPIPAILLAERQTGADDEFEIIDGLQRLHAIVSFIENGFKTVDGKYFNVKEFATAKRFADEGLFFEQAAEAELLLTSKEVSAILDYTLGMSIMRNATDDEIDDVFGRINTYGHRLSDQERRQAGVENDFSNMVRDIACLIRGDASADVLPLQKMPSISIDLPMTKHGYEVRAEEVVWVTHGVLRSTDLRDSMDEQCIADIAACVVGGNLIERSKDALDAIYDSKNPECSRINTALEVYGASKFKDEFKFCLDQLLQCCNADNPQKLRDLIFTKQTTTNPFPAAFAVIMVAIHEIVVKERKVISDPAAAKRGLTGLYKRIETTRKSTSAEERRKNVDTVKALINGAFVSANVGPVIYGSHASVDIEGTIRRSEIELSDYELKQGILTLDAKRKVDKDLIDKVMKTICAIANNGPGRVGKILLGVVDKKSDAERIQTLDKIEPKKVGKRFVVGVRREATKLGISMEDYYSGWKTAIKDSKLSDALKQSVLSHIDYNEFFGLGIIVITVPAQKELSYFEDQPFWRQGDSTVVAKSAKEIATLAQRF